MPSRSSSSLLFVRCPMLNERRKCVILSLFLLDSGLGGVLLTWWRITCSFDYCLNCNVSCKVGLEVSVNVS